MTDDLEENEEKFGEGKRVCEALRNLFKDELEAMKLESKEIGEHNKVLEVVEKNLNKGKTVEVIADFLGESVETVLQTIEEINVSKSI